MAFEIVNPTLIENTTMQKYINNQGVFRTYHITPVNGYVLHDKARDYTNIDEETMEEVLVLGYTRGTATCAANYDFTTNPREFYAVPESDVPDPENQIFSGGGGNHEVANVENGESVTE